mmetsp:Transcript_37553/g.58189  ORF Transcript_37553/g.58189 Transcript_37553/m.58189 type:complete len:308 (-) Transcript_37553:1559-2482(-)
MGPILGLSDCASCWARLSTAGSMVVPAALSPICSASCWLSSRALTCSTEVNSSDTTPESGPTSGFFPVFPSMSATSRASRSLTRALLRMANAANRARIRTPVTATIDAMITGRFKSSSGSTREGGSSSISDSCTIQKEKMSVYTDAIPGLVTCAPGFSIHCLRSGYHLNTPILAPGLSAKYTGSNGTWMRTGLLNRTPDGENLITISLDVSIPLALSAASISADRVACSTAHTRSPSKPSGSVKAVPAGMSKPISSTSNGRSAADPPPLFPPPLFPPPLFPPPLLPPAWPLLPDHSSLTTQASSETH